MVMLLEVVPAPATLKASAPSCCSIGLYRAAAEADR